MSERVVLLCYVKQNCIDISINFSCRTARVLNIKMRRLSEEQIETELLRELYSHAR